MTRNIEEAKKEFATVKKAFEAAMREASTLADDASLEADDPRYVEILERMNRLEKAYQSLLWVTL